MARPPAGGTVTYTVSEVARAMNATNQRVKNWLVGDLERDVENHEGLFTIEHVEKLALIAELTAWGIKVSDAVAMADAIHQRHHGGDLITTLTTEQSEGKASLTIHTDQIIEPVTAELQKAPSEAKAKTFKIV